MGLGHRHSLPPLSLPVATEGAQIAGREDDQQDEHRHADDRRVAQLQPFEEEAEEIDADQQRGVAGPPLVMTQTRSKL